MHAENLENISWQERLLRSVSLAVAIIAVCASLVAFAIGPFFQIAVLLVSAFVAFLVCRYEINFGKWSRKVSPNCVFLFWGAISLGLPGGILLASVASVSSNDVFGKGRRTRLQAAAGEVAGALLTTVVYYICLSLIRQASGGVQGLGYLPTDLLAASAAMAGAHALQKAARESFTAFLRRDDPASSIIVRYTIEAVIGLVLVLITVASLNHFGLEFGLIIAAIAALADAAYKIHNHRLGQKTREITEASRIHLATVEALATAIDARDQVGVGHARRTQIYAVGIGRLLELSESDINALRTGALLHDIGKLAVPDHILNKPGRLTHMEMEKTKTHSSVGASILEKVGFPYPVVPTVKYHHERWDGNGYPEGLSGTNIPLSARILSVADAYDALRISRAYRPAVPREEACKFLKSRAGSQYDPRVVELLLRNLRVFEAEIEAEGVSYETEESIAIGAFAPESGEASKPTYVEEIKKANHEAFTLFSMAEEFSSALSKDETLSLFTDKISEFAPFDTCIVYLFENAEAATSAVLVRGKNADLLAGRVLKVGEGATGLVLQQKRPMLDLDPSLDFASSNPELCREYSAMLSVPLIADDQMVGAVSLYSATLSSYQDEHLRLLETISRIGASAIRKSLQHAETETFALTDQMTGLPNARSLQADFEKEARRADRKAGAFQVLVLDLDGFKAVNDTYGHKAGDRMLREIGGVIRGQLREYDILARYGGDEFVAIVPDADQTHVHDLLKRIDAAVNNFSLDLGEGVFAKVGVSTGAAEYPSGGHTFDQIVAAADREMYLTKARHKRKAGEKTKAAAAGQAAEPIRAEVYLPAFGIDAVESHFDDFVVELDESNIIGTVDDAGIVAQIDGKPMIKSRLIN